MCGIAGIYYKDESKRVEEKVLKGMCDSIVHRGPDDEGYHIDANAGLGVRRLSVIDLAGGHQPVHNEDSTVWVALNGEIYNYVELRDQLMAKGHRFYTACDTEVIVHLYEEKGAGCLDDLDGMFSFAVFDSTHRTLFIARDRLGIKPLYYYDKDGIFACASEIKALLSSGILKKSLDAQALYHFLSLNYVPAPQTMFKDILQLPAGHYLMVTGRATQLHQYWDIHFDNRCCYQEDAAAERLAFLLEKSVKKMLRSDVPLGAFLSGGMDSSSLVSFIAGYSRTPLKTFSVGFDESSYNESGFAELAARAFGTEHYSIHCGPRDVPQCMPDIVWHADNLLADPSMLPLYLASKLAREHVTVCVSGDGGDELCMGYPTYVADRYLQRYKTIPSFLRTQIIRRMVHCLPMSTRRLSFDYKAKKFIEGSEFTLDKAHYWWRTVFNDTEKKALLSDDLLRDIGMLDSYAMYERHYTKCAHKGQMHHFDKYTYADIKVWLADDNLIRVDAMSMAHSLEVRVPFLDHALVEFMASVSPDLKMKNGALKYLLKKAMKTRLPPQIIARKKAGWQVPLAQWFQGELKDYVGQTLTGSRAAKSGLFKQEYIADLLGAHNANRCNNCFKIWGLLVFCHWYDAFY